MPFSVHILTGRGGVRFAPCPINGKKSAAVKSAVFPRISGALRWVKLSRAKNKREHM